PPPARSAADGRRPMVQILTLRERLAAVPGTVRRRAGGAGERLVAASAARAIAPEIPRTAGPDHLERAASRLLRRAAQDEFAREGVTRLPLPEGTDREALRRADVPGDTAFHAFVEDLLGAIDIAPSPLERDDAVALREGRGARDAYGLSPEVAGDLASYLLCLAHGLRSREQDQEPLEEYLARQETALNARAPGAGAARAAGCAGAARPSREGARHRLLPPPHRLRDGAGRGGQSRLRRAAQRGRARLRALRNGTHPAASLRRDGVRRGRAPGQACPVRASRLRSAGLLDQLALDAGQHPGHAVQAQRADHLTETQGVDDLLGGVQHLADGAAVERLGEDR